VEIKTERGWIRRNRYLMEQLLGRKLLQTEDAHHKNEIKDDDRIENLEVVGHGAHTVSHHRGAKRSSKALANIRAAFAGRSTARLDYALATSIRYRVENGEVQRRIAEELNVSPMTISRVVRRMAWVATEEAANGKL
jgi:hypothetical protein